MIKLKRIYEPPAPDDGRRFLVDRLWPRGVSKASAQLEAWVKDVAPSNDLRKWYNHDLDKWPEFRRRYAAELEAHPAAWEPLLEAARQGDITLLFGTRNLDRNNATALKTYLEERLATRT